MFTPQNRNEILGCSPKEIAKILALINHGQFTKISIFECLKLRWTGPDKIDKAPNLLNMIKYSNIISLWIKHIILK